jgi:DNA polymerase-3 subunit delta
MKQTIPFILIQGSDEFLVRRMVKEESAKLCERLPEAETVDCDADETDRYQFAEYSSPSLFSSSSVIRISGLERASDELIEALHEFGDESPAGVPADVWVIATCDNGVKAKKLVDTFEKQGAQVLQVPDLSRDSDRIAFINREFARFDRRVAPTAAQAIASVMSGQTGEIGALVEQLCADYDNNPMPLEIVQQYLIGSAQVQGFAIADDALAGRIPQALHALRSAIEQGIKPVAIVGALAMKLRTLGKAAAVQSGTASVAEAKVKPWQLKTANRQLSGWTSDALARCVEAVAHCDEVAKTSGGDAVFELERAVELIGMKGRVR